MGLTYHDVIRAFQSGASFATERPRGAAMDLDVYVAINADGVGGDVVEHGLSGGPTHLLWRGRRAASGLRDRVVVRRIGRDAP